MEEMGEIPGVVGAYRVLGVIGAGAMGVVLRAEHMLLGRSAAVKLLRPESSRNRDIVTRFFNEAKAATAIKHPGIVEIYDFGYLPSGAAFLVMEMLEGTTLEARVSARGRLTESEAFGIVRGIATALAAAHAKGIVHRDIKPENIFLVPDPDQPSRERIKLLDFGIAKLATDLGGQGGSTRTGSVMGTPNYMAPEQCRGAGRVDHRADLYSVGCVLMHLLTGAPPFTNAGVGETIGAHLFISPPTLRSRVPGASDRAEELVAALLAKDPNQRIQSATELVERVAAFGASSSLVVSGSVWVPPDGSRGAPHVSGTTLGSAARGSIQVERSSRRSWPLLVGGTTVMAAAAVLVALRVGVGRSTGARPITRPPGTGSTMSDHVAPGPLPAGDPVVAVPLPLAAAAPAIAIDAGVAIDAPRAVAVDAGASKPGKIRKTRKPEDLLNGL